MRQKSEVTLREAAQQALDALEVWRDCLTNPGAQPEWRFSMVGEKAITVLRAALAEEQNHVNKWVNVEENLPKDGELILALYDKERPLVVYKRESKYINDGWVDASSGHSLIPPTHWTPLPEYKHVHKMESNPTINEMETVEPMAWLHEWEGVVSINMTPPKFYGDHWKHTPLYTAPPKSEPLTDEEIQKCVGEVGE